MSPSGSSHENSDPQVLIDRYGLDTPVVVGEKNMKISLGQALDMERMFCPADVSKREDPSRRIGYLATILAAGGSLLPEDHHLLGDSK